MSEHVTSADRLMNEPFDPYGAPSEGGRGQVSPFAVAVRILRGRWWWALGLGATFGAVAIVCALKLPKVLYQSTGWIEVQPQIPRVLFKSDENQMHPMFSAYMDTQIALASSRRVVDIAMDSPDWKKLGLGRTDEDVATFTRRLQVSRQSQSLYLQVAYQDENPEVAMTAVNAVLDAYMKLVNEQESTSGSGTLKVLENKRQALNNQLTDLRATIQQLTDEKGADGLRERCQIATDELNKLDGMIGDLDLEITRLQAAESAPDRVPSEQEIALRDEDLKSLLQQRAEIEARVNYLENVEQRGSKDLEVVALRSRIAGVQRQIDERVQARRAEAATAPEVRAADLRERQSRRAAMVDMREKKDEEVRRLGKKRGQLEQIEAERANLNEMLEEVKRRLDEINVESQGAVRGRIRVAARGDRPVAPSSDKRVQFAVLGAFGGMGLGFGLVILFGLRHARMRHIADVDGRASRGRFLGILPDVQAGESPEETEAAAEMGDYCVHHVRTMVQLRSRQAKRVVSLTSPSPGSGKTTVTLSLAESFAAAGSRTLLIDCDLVGHGLTSAMRSLVCDDASRVLVGSAEGTDVPKIVRRHRIAELMTAREHRYDDAHVAELLESARELAAGGDEALVRTVRALEGLARPKAGGTAAGPARRGILGAVEGAPVEECVLELAQDNLFVLPVGEARTGDAVRLSHDGLLRLVAACRERYDTILIDTGPILGSIEAALATSVADSVLLVVTRGERQNLVNDALARLEEIGADVAGVIFNRASLDDVVRSKYVSRSASTPVEAA